MIRLTKNAAIAIACTFALLTLLYMFGSNDRYNAIVAGQNNQAAEEVSLKDPNNKVVENVDKDEEGAGKPKKANAKPETPVKKDPKAKETTENNDKSNQKIINNIVQAPGERAKACFVILARNSDVHDWRKSMRDLEDRFNKRYNYPYCFFNDVEFDDNFKTHVKALTSADVHFGLIPKEHWSVPSHIDEEKAKKAREDMEKAKIIYGGSLTYRHMCRQELMKQFEYYWRVEPGIEFACEIEEDPFMVMKKGGFKYGFTQSLHEYKETIPTLWDTTKEWIKERKLEDKLPKDNSMRWISDDNGEKYNGCHFWSNFEIASLDLWRDKQYLDYFDFLDKKGGFFYERWGDAPVHSIYAALTLPAKEIHFFNKIGYFHNPFWHCPVKQDLNLKCHCDPEKNFDLDPFSCNKKWFELNSIPFEEKEKKD